MHSINTGNGNLFFDRGKLNCCILYKLDLKIPVFIISINSTEDAGILAFDDSNDKMPLSGTIIPIKTNEFFLFNNSKYNQGDNCDYHFPVKVKITKQISNSSNHEISKFETFEMLNQIYQFSRIYWKSLKQQNLPVTVKYPKMLAKILPHFSDFELPAFGKSNLWFL